MGTPRRVQDFDADKVKFRGQGYSGTATASQSTNIQTKLTSRRLLIGLELFLSNHVSGDSCHFEVVDVDNVLGYGAEYVLDRFADTWYMDSSTTRQGPFIFPILADVPADIYLRVIFNSTGGTNVNVKINFHLYSVL